MVMWVAKKNHCNSTYFVKHKKYVNEQQELTSDPSITCGTPQVLTPSLHCKRKKSNCKPFVSSVCGSNHDGFICKFCNERLFQKPTATLSVSLHNLKKSSRTPQHQYPPTRRKCSYLLNISQFLSQFIFSNYFNCSLLLFWYKFLILWIFFGNLLIHVHSSQQNYSYSQTVTPTQRTINEFASCAVSFSNISNQEFCQYYFNCPNRSNCFTSHGLHSTYAITEISASQLGRISEQYRELTMSPNIMLDFCTHFPMNRILKVPYFKTSNECLNKVMKMKENDEKAKSAYLLFEQVFARYASPSSYSTRWNKTQCLANYKSWTCAQHHSLYSNSCAQILQSPCAEQCLRVEASCPVFRIFNRTKLRGGQPVFICQGFRTPHEQDPADCYLYPELFTELSGQGSLKAPTSPQVITEPNYAPYGSSYDPGHL